MTPSPATIRVAKGPSAFLRAAPGATSPARTYVCQGFAERPLARPILADFSCRPGSNPQPPISGDRGFASQARHIWLLTMLDMGPPYIRAQADLAHQRPQPDQCGEAPPGNVP